MAADISVPPGPQPTSSALATAVGLALATTTVFAQESGRAQLVQEDVTVIGQRQQTEVSSTKFTAPLIDTPKSVTVISQALIAETGSTSLVDALRTVPGITFNAGEGGQPAGDNLKIRGFDAGADVFIDGIRDAGSQTRDVFALEQIEVVKGPGSAYSGRGSSGGSVNLVTKRPRDDAFVTTNLGAGTDNYGRVAVDTNLRFGDSAGFRLNLLRQDTDVPGRAAVTTSHAGIAPSLAFGIGEPTRVNLDFYRYETDDIPDYSIPYARNAANTAPQGGPVDVDRENFYGLVNRDFQETSADVRTIQVAHDLASGITFSNTLRYGPVRDPVKSLVECGVGDDVDTVIVDGKTCMEGGVIPGVDFGKLRGEAQAAGEDVWATVSEWDPLGRTAEQACPWSYPIL